MFLNTPLKWTWSKYSIHVTGSLAAVGPTLGNNIATVMTFKIHRTCSWESIGKIIYCFIDINRNIMMVCMIISESAMIGGIGSC